MSEFSELMKQVQAEREEKAKQEAETHRKHKQEQHQRQAEETAKKSEIHKKYSDLRNVASVIAGHLVSNEVAYDTDVVAIREVQTKKLFRTTSSQIDVPITKGWKIADRLGETLDRKPTPIMVLEPSSRLVDCRMRWQYQDTKQSVAEERVQHREVTEEYFLAPEHYQNFDIETIEKGLAALAVTHGIDPALFENNKPE